MMGRGLLARTIVVAACLFLSGAESAACADTQMDVTSTADAQDHVSALNCTGGAEFNVTWYGNVEISQTFEVAGGISLNVTGSGSSALSLDDDTPTASIVGDEITSETGIFYVSGSSTLTLDNLVLQGAYSVKDSGAGAVEVQGSNDTNTTVNVIDCLFTDNIGTAAGAIYAHDFAVVNIYGATNFTGNTGNWSAGAITAESESRVSLYGASTFRGNTGKNGGGIYASAFVVVNIYGSTLFIGNTGLYQGAVTVSYESRLYLYGAITFRDNIGSRGGALGVYSHNSAVHFEGDTNFVNNTATTDSSPSGGGALYVFSGEVTIGGSTTFTNNTSASDGGAIYATGSNVTIEDVVFTGNSATEDGGAIYAEETNINITGGTTFTNNLASGSGGGLSSTESETVAITGGASFVGNLASVNGGAMSLDTPGQLDVHGATFVLSEAASGGAVSLVATTSADFGSYVLRRCTFEENSATDGGALYLFNSARGVYVDESVFRENVAGASGGAIYHTGKLASVDTRFEANKAGVQGMAVTSLGELYGAENTSFVRNARYCPLGQYGYDEDVELAGGLDTCRAEVVCTRCSDGCDDVLDGLSFPSNSTVPAEDCKNLPVGTVASSAGTTLATLELAKGYYRTSAESHVVLECYQEDSCIGGVDASNYCAAGYEGPYCAVCAEDYAPGISYSCHKCSGTSLGSAVGLVLATMIVFLGVVVVVVSDLVAVVKVDGSAEEEQEGARDFWEWKLSSCHNFLAKMFPLASIKIVVVVWQILTQFAAIAGAVYPDEYQAFLSKLSPINLDIGSILSYSCIADTNFYDRLLLTTMMPLVVFAVLVGTYTIAKKKNGRSEVALRSVQHKHLSAALFVMFFVYSSVSFTVFQTFVCDPLDDGVDYLRADYSLSCWSDQHVGYVTYAGVMVFVYPIGIPAAFTWWLARNRHDLTKPGRETVARLQPFAGLWAAYRPSRFYYEVVECGRRIALTGIAVFVLPGSAAQIAVVLLLAVVFSFISESMQPFKKRVEMGLYRWGNGVVLASMYVALLRKVDVSGDDTPTQSAFAGVLIAANVFMIVAVLVQSALFVKQWHASKKTVEVDDRCFRSTRKSSVPCIQVVGDDEETEMDAADERMENT